MRTRLLLISHPATAAQRKGAFPDDDPLDAPAADEAAAFRASNAPLLDADLALSSPAACARDTAKAFGLAAHALAALADADYGRWRGRRLLELSDEEPDALAAWARDPSAAPHGGESFDALRFRVGGWLDALEHRGNTVAVTHASVIRAALIHVLQAPPAAFARIDVPPLAVVELRRSERGWTWRPTPHRPA
ncbi:histidine phosphatase family protein [Paraburkholderia phymatum]|uniref:Phosphoglycerate mutase n=1 Tax=Paraburkholderia phymatum (strain DSM 17167 / CIP 108236 / LMG 21445 / STM815) TaxID=391038 RepID=B2JL62_PARP8|nr:histidine phosphatase family protein [Paraburkholderia phymatum]ACC72591.1 Phosphoglycerate mutase [Paraburkholderia phymatum STM815]